MKFKCGIIVVKKGTTTIYNTNDVLHFCGYQEEITTKESWKHNKDNLYRELRDDKDHNFEHDLNDCEFFMCMPELLEYYNEEFKDVSWDDDTNGYTK